MDKNMNMGLALTHNSCFNAEEMKVKIVIKQEKREI